MVAFALLCEGLSPKRFAGLFGAAPAVALASLTIVVVDQGAAEAHRDAIGMIAGAAGMIAYALAVVRLLHRMRAAMAAVVALGAWALVAAIVAVPLVLT